METNIKLKEIKINSSIKKYELKTTLLGYGNKGLPGKDGINGENGATFTPSVDNEGNLSWTNNGNLDNPETKNIKGPKGDKGDAGPKGESGPKGDTGEGVPSGGTTGQVLKKKSNMDYDTEWVNESGGSGGTSDYTDLNNKPKINNVELSGNKSLSDLGITNFSGDYNDLSNKPDIPKKTSDLTNDSGFIDSSYHDNTKQDTLVSGTNIKTINNESILGEGNISISGGSSLNNVLDGNAIGSARTIGANDSRGLSLGEYAWAEGQLTTAYGKWSHAEGYNSAAQGNYSHAEGYSTMASSNYSHAEGSITTASGNYSHAEGLGTKASSNCSHAQGKYNISDTSNEYAHIVGNGNSSIDTSNAHTIDWQGNAWFSGDVYVRSTSGKNKDDGSKKLATEDMVNTSLSGKQNILISGTNIKTINNESILGSGNLTINTGVTDYNQLENKPDLTALNYLPIVNASEFKVTASSPTSTLNYYLLQMYMQEHNYYTVVIKPDVSFVINAGNYNEQILNTDNAFVIFNYSVDPADTSVLQLCNSYVFKNDTITMLNYNDISFDSSTKKTVLFDTSIKTVNNQSLIGEGNLTISGAEIPIGSTPPENPKDGDFWIDTSANGETYGDTLPIGAMVEYNGTTVPQGYEKVSDNNIIESGSNENGNWIRYADGTMICTNRYFIQAQGNTTIQSGALYVSNEIEGKTFPATFTNRPGNIFLNFENATWGDKNIISIKTIGYPTSSVAPSIQLVSATSSTNTAINFEYLAIGKWK